MADNTSKNGTRAEGKSRRASTNYAKEAIRSVVARASAGEPGTIELLDRWLAEYPEHRRDIEALRGLTDRAEAAWVRAAGLGNPLAERAAREDAAALKAELLPPGAGVLDRVLVGAVVVARLAHAHAALLAATGATAPAVQAARDRRLLDTQKLLLNAVKGWRLITEKRAGGLRAPLKVFDGNAPAAS